MKCNNNNKVTATAAGAASDASVIQALLDFLLADVMPAINRLSMAHKHRFEHRHATD